MLGFTLDWEHFQAVQFQMLSCVGAEIIAANFGVRHSEFSRYPQFAFTRLVAAL